MCDWLDAQDQGTDGFLPADGGSVGRLLQKDRRDGV